MSELHKFMFDGLPVRGAIVRLTDDWVDILSRRAANTASGPYPVPVQELLGEMAAAGVLMQSNIKFDGALILQIQGDGPVKLAVAEVNADFSLRATATLLGEVAHDATLSQMVNVNNVGKCAITLDAKNRRPGQQAYQGVVPLFDDHKEKLEHISEVLAHYMLQSEQLETTLVLAADDKVAAGLLIQKMPAGGGKVTPAVQKELEANPNYLDAYNRLSILASSLKREEVLTLDVDTILRRLFWQEPLLRFEPPPAELSPRFACTCSRERVGRMLRSLGRDEAESIIAERGEIEVGCEFCGQQYRFDAVDAALVFVDSTGLQGTPGALQ
jgi:molecular chaperone Hsp33